MNIYKGRSRSVSINRPAFSLLNFFHLLYKPHSYTQIHRDAKDDPKSNLNEEHGSLPCTNSESPNCIAQTVGRDHLRLKEGVSINTVNTASANTVSNDSFSPLHLLLANKCHSSYRICWNSQGPTLVMVQMCALAGTCLCTCRNVCRKKISSELNFLWAPK